MWTFKKKLLWLVCSILSAGYIPTITLPTRLSGSSSLIDNIFTDNVSVEMSAYILNNHIISDHQPVVLFCNIDVLMHKHKYITIQTKSDEAKAMFRSTFKNKHVLNKLDAESTDPNHNYEILEVALRESLIECFPTRTVRFNVKRHKKTAWITSGIIKSINHRNKLFRQTNSDAFCYIEKQTAFNRYRNELKKTITHAKRLHYKTIFNNVKNDMKKTWAIISDTLNKNSRPSIPETMTINDTTCHDKQVIADKFNLFFASIGEMNETNTAEHVDSSYKDYLTKQIDSNFDFRLIDNRYTLKIIKDIKMSMSKGHDGISSELLKLVNDDISSCITLIINQ